jgi:taurine dioxygenase
MLDECPLEPFGAIVSADLSQPLTREDEDRLRELLWDRQVLIFKRQDLSHERQAEIIDIFESVPRTREGMHFVSTEADKGGLGRGELTFHSDCSFMAKPRIVLSLHAVDVVDGASSTQWISARNGWNAMPAALRARLEHARAVQVMPSRFTDRLSTEHIPEWLPHHWHDALITHPKTGERLPYLMEMQTARIEGLAPAESKALIEEALLYLYRPSAVLEHVWENGDFVIWDNIATQHARGSLAGKGRRTLQKVQAGGEALQDWPAFHDPEVQALLADTAKAEKF